MGNRCGCSVFDEKVGMYPPVPVQYQSIDLGQRKSYSSLPSYFDVDLTSVLIGGVAATILIYVAFGQFWRHA